MLVIWRCCIGRVVWRSYYACALVRDAAVLHGHHSSQVVCPAQTEATRHPSTYPPTHPRAHTPTCTNCRCASPTVFSPLCRLAPLSFALSCRKLSTRARQADPKRVVFSFGLVFFPACCVPFPATSPGLAAGAEFVSKTASGGGEERQHARSNHRAHHRNGRTI